MTECRLISGKPSLRLPAGNPEGSPSDPVTTDPKGEVVLKFEDPRHAGPHRSNKDTYEECRTDKGGTPDSKGAW